MPPSIRTACATASLLAVAATANAQVLTVEYKAVFVDPTPGVEIVGTYSFDSKAVPTVVSEIEARYPVLAHKFTLTKDGGGPSSFGVTNSHITIVNDERFNDSLRDRYFVDGQTDGLFGLCKDLSG